LLAEDKIGSIEAGKYVDFIVLDQNLFEIPVDAQTHVNLSQD
jgi:predicted amidohydrolase YtcJ